MFTRVEGENLTQKLDFTSADYAKVCHIVPLQFPLVQTRLQHQQRAWIMWIIWIQICWSPKTLEQPWTKRLRCLHCHVTVHVRPLTQREITGYPTVGTTTPVIFGCIRFQISKVVTMRHMILLTTNNHLHSFLRLTNANGEACLERTYKNRKSISDLHPKNWHWRIIFSMSQH